MDLCPAQTITVLAFLVPVVIGVLIGALIITVKERKNSNKKNQITVFVRFKNGTNFAVSCEKDANFIFCPFCSFKNKNPYRISKHLKMHFKKGEGKDRFIAQQEPLMI